MKKTVIKGWNKLNSLICHLDCMPFGWVGILLLCVTFAPYLYLKGGSVFDIHDQLDETILSYVLNAKYLGDGVNNFSELLGGISKGGLQPSAVIFVPLYRVFPVFVAFVIQYAIIFLCGYWGMYFSVKRMTRSSILATIMATCFCLLPLPPIYGLSCMGVPLCLYAFLCLRDRKNVVVAYGLLVFFALSTHLILIGYVVLCLWGCYWIYMLLKKSCNYHLFIGLGVLTILYICVNYQLVLDFLIKDTGYISHREEAVYEALEFKATIISLFIDSGPHAVSLHKYLILPIVCMLLLLSFWLKRMDRVAVKKYQSAVLGFCGLIFIAFIYAFLKIEPIMNWRNSLQGFMKFFQVERFYWLYPAGWYIEFALVFSVWWGDLSKATTAESKGKYLSEIIRFINSPFVKLACVVILLIPTLLLIKVNSYFYKNVNQMNNGTAITGYITWESYYSEELMEQLDQVIGRDKSTYRIAHLGMSPAPALVYGFYTVDGYSNNYPLDYKHRFREVIAAELEKNPAVASYFDMWGSRCYLFNSQSGTYYLLAKGRGFVYEPLEFDMEALRNLGCEYIFSGGEIADPSVMGLELVGYYETETSYWGVWLYKLNSVDYK